MYNTHMIVRSNGNIGIGTITPTARLSVKAAGTGTGLLVRFTDSADAPKVTVLDNGNVGIGIENPSYPLEVKGPIRTIANDPTLYLTDTDTSVQNYITANSSVGSVGINVDTASAMTGSFVNFSIDGTSKMRILENGNVGIGVINPSARFTAKGAGT